MAGAGTIEMDRVGAGAQTDPPFVEAPHYVTPNAGVGQEAFAVMREAMRNKAVVGLGRVVLSKRERVIALEPYGAGLLGTTLRYPYEVRDAAGPFATIAGERPLAPELLELAGQ